MELPPRAPRELGAGLSDTAQAVLRAAIVTVGDELLYGATVDTNGAWMGQALAERGIPVVERRVVGEALHLARERGERLIVVAETRETAKGRTCSAPKA